jgi:hypothetical protein
MVIDSNSEIRGISPLPLITFTTGYIGFPIGNIQLVKVYIGLTLASLVV